MSVDFSPDLPLSRCGTAEWVFILIGKPDQEGIAIVPTEFCTSLSIVSHSILSMPDGRIVLAGRAGNDIGLARLLGDSDQSGAAANLPPENTVPVDQLTEVNTPLAFTTYRGSEISVSDPDAALVMFLGILQDELVGEMLTSMKET